MSEPTAGDVTVFIVDDDPDVRDFLARLIATTGWKAETYERAQLFLESYDRTRPGCLVLDINMPGMTGLELQRELNARGIRSPIVILTGAGDVPTAREAFRAGVVDFVQKPFRNQELVEAITRALARDAEIRNQEAIVRKAQSRFSKLSPREREVMDLMVVGKTTKEIAYQLSLSPKTVDVHRANGMKKLGVDSIAELVRLAVDLDSGGAARAKTP